MIFYLKVGNSQISWGRSRKSVRSIDKNFLTEKWFFQTFGMSNKIVFLSVVPKISRLILRWSKKYRHKVKEVRLKDIPIKPAYNKVGIDRLLNVWGASRKFTPPFVCVDFGTATTVDFVGRGPKHLGGFILPGITMGLNALADRTALLGRYKLTQDRGRSHIGQSTKEAIVGGQHFMVDALINACRRMSRRLWNHNATIIVTGGHLAHIKIKSVRRVDSLSLKALEQIQLK